MAFECPECGHNEESTDDLEYSHLFPADLPNRELEQPACPACGYEVPVTLTAI